MARDSGQAVRYSPGNDSKLLSLCGKVASQIPSQAIIITGSRATGHGLTPESDYDMLVVMPTPLVPFYLGKLRRLEVEMARELGAEVTLSPLARFRLRHARGNLFLYKLKHEGVTLWGRDLLRTMDPGSVADIGPQWRFSYLFTGMKHLGQDFEPEHLQGKPILDRKLGKSAAKATLYCGEVLSLMHGFYFTDPEEMVAWNSQPEHACLGASFAPDLKTALAWRSSGAPAGAEALSLWLKARDYLRSTFCLLNGGAPDLAPEDFQEVAQRYLTAGVWPKNWQYFALAMLLKRQVWWATLPDIRPIDRRFHLALLFLLSSAGQDGTISRPWLERACRLLDGRARAPRRGDDLYALWRELHATIYSSWALACPLMGI